MTRNKSVLILIPFFALFSFFIPAFFAANCTLNHFYVEGGHLLDAGWLAYLSAYSQNILPINPPMLGDYYFFSVHISPFFIILSFLYKFLSAFLSIPYAIYFSIWQGIFFGLLSLAAFYLFLPSSILKIRYILYAFSFSMASMLNGVSLSIVIFPHFEIAIPSLILCFFALWSKGYKKFCYFPLCFALLIREDAGLHYFCIFIFIAFYFYFFKKTKENQNLFFYYFKLAFFCFFYSLLVIVFQKIIFHPNIIYRVYFGDPIFSHLNYDFFHSRILFILTQRAFIYIPIFMIFLLSFIRKDLFLSLGGIIILPWMIFSFFAISFDAGTYTWYYSFPLLILFFWPAIENTFFNFNHFERKKYYFLLTSSFIMIASSFFLFMTSPKHCDRCYQSYHWNIFGLEWIHHWQKNQNELDLFLNKVQKKHFIVDTATASLELDKINKNEFYWQALEEKTEQDFMIFLPKSLHYKDTLFLIKQQKLSHICRLGLSDYFLATKEGDPYGLCFYV